MKRLRFYLTLVWRHFRHSGAREALRFAKCHWRFWQGAEGSGQPYVHIGSSQEKS